MDRYMPGLAFRGFLASTLLHPASEEYDGSSPLFLPLLPPLFPLSLPLLLLASLRSTGGAEEEQRRSFGGAEEELRVGIIPSLPKEREWVSFLLGGGEHP